MPLLRLIRLPGVFTAVADVLAGYLLARFLGAGEGELRALPFLACASACIYAAGMAWNDIFDRDIDAKTRPERPIPSGDIPLTAAFFIAAALSAAGLLLAMAAGYACFLSAAGLLLAVLFYDSGGKQLPLVGPLTMGLCRGLNLALGMTAHRNFALLILEPANYLGPVFLCAYTAALTVASSLETPEPREESEKKEEPAADSTMDTVMEEPEPAPPAPRAPAPAFPGVAAPEQVERTWLLALAAACALLVPLAAAAVYGRGVISFAITALLLFSLLRRAWPLLLHPSHAKVRALVGCGIGGMVLLDAAMVAGAAASHVRNFYGFCFQLPDNAGLAGVALVLGLALPAAWLRKRIMLT